MEMTPDITLLFILLAALLFTICGWAYTIHVLVKTWENTVGLHDNQFELDWHYPLQHEEDEQDPLWSDHPWKDRCEHPENVETEIAEVPTSSGEYRAKRRKPESDRQSLLHVVDEKNETFVKYAGGRFSDEAIRQICDAHSRGRGWKQEGEVIATSTT